MNGSSYGSVVINNISYSEIDMDQLHQIAKIAFASEFSFALKAQNFHWNVEGPNFPQLHEFFSDLYNEVYDNTIDRSAEFVRVLDTYTPGSMVRFAELSVIQEQAKIPRAELMMAELLEDSTTMVSLVTQLFDIATESRDQGLANYLAELQDLYTKKAWMLRSILKTTRA